MMRPSSVWRICSGSPITRPLSSFLYGREWTIRPAGVSIGSLMPAVAAMAGAPAPAAITTSSAAIRCPEISTPVTLPLVLRRGR